MNHIYVQPWNVKTWFHTEIESSKQFSILKLHMWEDCPFLKWYRQANLFRGKNCDVEFPSFCVGWCV